MMIYNILHLNKYMVKFSKMLLLKEPTLFSCDHMDVLDQPTETQMPLDI